MTAFATKDTGVMTHYESGMVRDSTINKPLFNLLIAENVPYKDQMLTRLADLMMRGGLKYGDRNWEQACSKEELERMKSSAFRHFVQWLCGEDDEDHAAAVMFNIIAHESTRAKMVDTTGVGR